MRQSHDGLSDRQKLVLKAVVEAYIETGEPVGSKALVSDGKIPFSSATIRGEMAELEEKGYLEQPHTSAGRIPSESGYRFYVDSLVEEYDLTNREIAELKNTLRSRQTELDNILESAMKLASSLTNYPALAVKPHAAGKAVSRFECVYLDPFSLLLVMVMQSGPAKTKTVKYNRPVSEGGCADLAAVLNECLAGLTAGEMTYGKMMDVEARLGEVDYLAGPAVKAIYQTLSEDHTDELRVEGVNRLLAYPEYCDFGRLRDMLTMFEDKTSLLDVMAASEADAMENDDSDDVRILIGRENPINSMENSTLIFKPVKSGGKTVGAIGIIGPTRMDYSRVIAMINRLSDSVTELMENGSPRLADPGRGDTEEHNKGNGAT